MRPFQMQPLYARHPGGAGVNRRRNRRIGDRALVRDQRRQQTHNPQPPMCLGHLFQRRKPGRVIEQDTAATVDLQVCETGA